MVLFKCTENISEVSLRKKHGPLGFFIIDKKQPARCIGRQFIETLIYAMTSLSIYLPIYTGHYSFILNWFI